MKKTWRSVTVIGLGLFILAMFSYQRAEACDGCGCRVAAAPAKSTPPAKAAKIIPQTTCPIMGGAINKKLYVDYQGKRIYVCCAGCINAVKKDFAKYTKELEAKGITLDKAPLTLCPKCGEIKGTAKCCKIEGRTKCAKCGLFKGSPGCCRIPKGTKTPVTLCIKCGEITGSVKCCKLEGRTKCAKCGLFKGSPGCCKLPVN